MTITFESDSDIIVYALEKIISFARENQYLFVANCAWWLAGVIGLDSGLIIFIDCLETRKQAYQPREVSTTPRDIARSISADPSLRIVEEGIIASRAIERQPAGKPQTQPGNRVKKLSKKQRRKLAGKPQTQPGNRVKKLSKNQRRKLAKKNK
jgi:hypothetical protein